MPLEIALSRDNKKKSGFDPLFFDFMLMFWQKLTSAGDGEVPMTFGVPDISLVEFLRH